MKLHLITPVLVGLFTLNSCCTIVSFVPLDEDNAASVKLMTDKTAGELTKVEDHARAKKAELDASSTEAAAVRLAYSDIGTSLDALVESLKNDYRAGEKKPTANSTKAAGALNDKIKAFTGHKSALGWETVLISIFKPLAEDLIQKERGACAIEEALTLKPYSDL